MCTTANGITLFPSNPREDRDVLSYNLFFFWSPKVVSLWYHPDPLKHAAVWMLCIIICCLVGMLYRLKAWRVDGNIQSVNHMCEHTRWFRVHVLTTLIMTTEQKSNDIFITLSLLIAKCLNILGGIPRTPSVVIVQNKQEIEKREVEGIFLWRRLRTILKTFH